MMNRKVLTFLIFLIAFSGSVFSQKKDFGLWYGVTARHQIKKKLNVDLTGSMRTFNNASQTEEYFLEGGLQYKLNKHFSAMASYKIIKRLEEDSKYYYRHRLFLDLKASKSIGNFDFSARFRFQRTNKTYINDFEDLRSQYCGRLKLKVLDDIPDFPFSPYISYENFRPMFSDKSLTVSKNRYSAGVEIQLTRHSKVDVEYILQRDFHPELVDTKIISLNYTVKF